MNETRCYCDRCGVRIQHKFAHQVYLGADSSSSANEASAVDLCNSCFDSLNLISNLGAHTAKKKFL